MLNICQSFYLIYLVDQCARGICRVAKMSLRPDYASRLAQTSQVISGSFAENDLHYKGDETSLPPCVHIQR